jgi:hypothetical protein
VKCSQATIECEFQLTRLWQLYTIHGSLFCLHCIVTLRPTVMRIRWNSRPIFGIITEVVGALNEAIIPSEYSLNVKMLLYSRCILVITNWRHRPSRGEKAAISASQVCPGDTERTSDIFVHAKQWLVSCSMYQWWDWIRILGDAASFFSVFGKNNREDV